MSDWRERWTDERVELIIGTLLRAGVLLAAAVVIIGGIWYLFRYGMAVPRYNVYSGEPSDLRHISGIVRGVVGGHSRNIMQLGLILLIATPVTRVAFSLGAFAIERDRRYIVITTIVLGVLLYSLIGSH